MPVLTEAETARAEKLFVMRLHELETSSNLCISMLPGVLSVASVHQRLWMAQTALLVAGAGGFRSGLKRGLFLASLGLQDTYLLPQKGA